MTNLQMLRKLPARDVAILISTIVSDGICSFCPQSCAEPNIKGVNLNAGCVQGLHRWLNQEAEGAFWTQPDGQRIFLRHPGCSIK